MLLRGRKLTPIDDRWWPALTAEPPNTSGGHASHGGRRAIGRLLSVVLLPLVVSAWPEVDDPERPPMG